MGINFLDMTTDQQNRTKAAIRGDNRNDLFKYGFGPVTTSWGVIWNAGNGYDGFLGTAQKLNVLSTDALDADGLPGCNIVEITGLNARLEQVIEYVTMNGVTPVETANEYCTVFRVRSVASLATALFTGNNQGTITVQTQAGGPIIVAQIDPNDGQTLMAIWQCPMDKRGKLLNVEFYIPDGKNIEADILYQNYGTGAWNTAGRVVGGTSKIGKSFENAQNLLPGTKLVAVGKIDQGTSVMGCTFEVKMYDLNMPLED